MNRSDARVLIVGLGGLGCPAALGLAEGGIGLLGLSDDDVVESTNLHRQILFGESDVGRDKVEVAASSLADRYGTLSLRLHRTRILPENAISMVAQYDVVVEGSDNFATKFLVADACALAGVPVVHGAAVRWVGTALAISGRGGPCYRCLFEDVPRENVPNCAEAGVFGPVVGVVAAAQVDFALRIADGEDVRGELVTFDGRTLAFRRIPVGRRHDCTLCGLTPRIRRIDAAAYVSPVCLG